MQIIKDRKIIDNAWTFVEDNSPLPLTPAIISLNRWQKDADSLKSHSGKLAIRLQSHENIADLTDALTSINMVELFFPIFTDGRGFSQAKLLRDRYQFTGEIRASGHFMVDQVFYMSKVGINAFQLADESQLALAVSLIDDFSVSYQELLFS
jgi:uncharacterized protein (DUF934 family)